ncbi:transglycosylase SLT domain-containing protein [Nocardia sp. NPDC049526]|uniref:transglycosylase SLT domain-containing protein n=1 Tax=Nocardia sp. NPDC049526 TaxID=3364316 RepID=UPI0037B84912
MTLTIDNVSNWHPEKLGDAGEQAKKVADGLDGVVGKGVTDTKGLEDTKAWSGAAGQAANTRMETEKSRAGKVSTELHALQTAFNEQVQSLQSAKDAVLRLRNDAINQNPPFEVSADGTVSAAPRIAEIRRAEGEGSNTEMNEQHEAARRQWELVLALQAAETAANTARDRIRDAVGKLQAAFNDLGDPNLGVTQTQNTSTTPAATTSTTSKPSYVTSSHNGGGSGSSSGTSNYGTSGGTHNATGAMPTGDVAEWIKKAKAKLIEMGYSPDQIDERALAMIIEHESGGNPLIVNDWDSNAAAGHPSKGLMQTIDSTFNAYKAPGHENIYDPVDNIIAGTRYAIDRYGSLSNVPGVAAVNSGGAYQGY